MTNTCKLTTEKQMTSLTLIQACALNYCVCINSPISPKISQDCLLMFQQFAIKKLNFSKRET